MLEPSSDIAGRALVMDADASRLMERCRRLESSDWQTRQACNVVEALATVREGLVDVVVLHLSAVEAEAADLPRVLRLAAGMPYLPVVVLAFEPAEDLRCRFLDCGADDMAADSISPAELAARLRTLMRVKRLQDELHTSREALSASLTRERALLVQLRRDNAHLLTLCSTDPLTRLQNVWHFDSFLEDEFKVARRYDRKLSVLALDLDFFKLINDAHGHPSGDFILKEFAVILKQAVRESDLVARTGGEEFGIVLPQSGRRQARRLAERIRRAVAQHVFNVFGAEIRVTTSIGLASYPEDALVTEPHMLVYFADQALLRAKHRGRNQATAFDDLDVEAQGGLAQQYRASCRSRQIKMDAAAEDQRR